MLQIVKLCVWEAEFVSHLCSANAAENLTDDDDDDDGDDDDPNFVHIEDDDQD